MPIATSNTAAAGPGEPSSSSSRSSSALASASITTSEQLVKALRMPQPPANGVSKIDIALEACQSSTFFVPKKAELLSQWVLEYLCSSLRTSSSASTPGTPNKGKNKSKQQKQLSTNTQSVLDLKAWELLSAIVTAQISTDSELSEAAKRSWLSHLANTQPALALAGALAKQLNHDQSLSQAERENLLTSASSSLVKLLPPATSRTAATNVEAATDAIQAWLDFFGQQRSTVEQHNGSAILSSIAATWSTTLQYGSNAKRNHQHFCNTAVPSLLQAFRTLSASEADDEASLQLTEVVRQVAAESLFTEDVQRSMLQAGRNAEVTRSPSRKDTKTATSGIAQQLTTLLQDGKTTEAALSSLPVLSELLFTKLGRSEALNSIASSSSTSSGLVRETQLSLVRKTMLSEWLFPLLPSLVTSSGTQGRQAQRAAARKGLLQGIERDSLYIMGSDEHQEWRSFFSTMFDSVRTELQYVAIDASPAAQSVAAVHFACLTSLWRLEKSVVEDDLVPVLAMVAVQKVSKEAFWKAEQLSASTRAAMDFFRAVASIDVRFRTIPALVNSVLSSIGAAAKLEHNGLASSLFTSQTFLAELGKLCHDNVTPTQVPDLIKRLTGIAANLDSVHRESSVNGSATPKAKKQRTSTTSPGNPSTQALTQIAHALVAQLQIAAQVVQSVQLAPTLRPRSITAAEELHNILILPCLDSCTSLASATVLGVAAAALRVRQALLSEKWRYDPSEPVKLDGSLPTENLSCLETAFDERADALIESLALRKEEGAELCQLHFQIVHSLMQRAERDSFLGYGESRYCQLLSRPSGPVYDLSKELFTITIRSEWSGCPNSIKDRGELMQVLWLAVVTRWAPLFESLAADETLTLLASVLASTVQTSEDSAMGYISSTALRNASFLELPRWRNHIIAHIQHELSNSNQLERRLAATAPLWITPNEWVNKASRGSLVVKLFALDKDIVSAKKGGTVKTKQWTELRNLIARVVAEYATESDVSDEALLASLHAFDLNAKEANTDERYAWERSSLAAISSTTRVLLSRSKNNNNTKEKLVKMAQEFKNTAIAQEKAGDGEITLKMRAAQEMYTYLEARFASEDDPDAVNEPLEAIRKLDKHVESTGELVQMLDAALYYLRDFRLLIDNVRDISKKKAVLRKVTARVPNIFAWGKSLLNAQEKPQKVLVRSAADLALEYLRCIERGSSGIPGAEAVIAGSACWEYTKLIEDMPPLQGQRQVTDELHRIISHLEPEQYDKTLSRQLLLLDSDTYLPRKSLRTDARVAATIHAFGLALSSAPQGTSKVARKYLSSLLTILSSPFCMPAGGESFMPRSIVAAASAFDELCSNHAMLFRAQDMGAILQLLSRITGPSMADEPSPALVDLSHAERDVIKTKLWNAMLSILGSLMRLRQDLVLGFLPQLGSLLSRLTTLFRRLRSTSGSAKRQLRRDLPAWLDPVLVSPLDADHDARALSRLLSTLVVKNVSLKHRSASTAEGGGKAESLARPFSKHATYILVAYLRSLTASNTTVPAEVRQELEVGMMTVCGIVGHHQRDAAMVGLLDSAGKVLMKRIWGEYEKQRYKGQ